MHVGSALPLRISMTTLQTPNIDTGRDLATRWLDAFAVALRARDFAGAAGLFLDNGYWRDILAGTWDLRTFAGPERIARGLHDSAELVTTATGFRLETTGLEVYERRSWGWSIEGFFVFETAIGWCRGHLRLLVDPDDPSGWKAWTLLTTLEDLKAFEEKAGHRRPRGAHVAPGNPARVEEDDGAEAHDEPEVVVVGAGHAGLSLAARLHHLDVRTLVVERHPRIGDNWRTRYQSLVLHNEVWANHLPYLPFPATWPVYIAKDQLADWLESYARILSLDVSTSTSLRGGKYDESTRRWTLSLEHGDGTVRVVRPRHLVFATGVFGPERRVHLPGADVFEGELMHSVEYKGNVRADGLKALVIGSGSSAHDVAQDLAESGAEVTMLQRGSTCVVSVDPGAARAYAIYREDGPPVEDCDLVSNAFPLPLLAELHKDMTNRIAEMDADLLEGLRQAGFALDFGEDGSGFLMKYHRYGGGYYINVGCSELIVDGTIKVKQGVEVDHLTEHEAVFTDGTALPADLVVIAAGFDNMCETVRRALGDEVADRVGRVWGLDEEGEVRAMWRRTGQPGFWLMGGSLQQCRPYSKYLAEQIKGELEGLLPERR